MPVSTQRVIQVFGLTVLAVLSFVSFGTLRSSRPSISDAMCRLVSNNSSVVSLTSSIASSRSKSQDIRNSFSDWIDRKRSYLARSPSQRSVHDAATGYSPDILVLKSKFDQGIEFSVRSQWEAAELIFKECLPSYDSLGPRYAHTALELRFELARSYFYQGRFDEARPEFERVLQDGRALRLYRKRWPSTTCLEYLVRIADFKGKLGAMEDDLREQADREPARNDDDDEEFLKSFHFALIHMYQFRIRECLPEFENLLPLCKRLYGSTTPITMDLTILCLRIYTLLGYTKMARQLLATVARDINKVRIEVDTLTDMAYHARYLCFHKESKLFSNKALEELRRRDLTKRRNMRNYVKCNLHMAVAYDNEGKSTEAEQFFSQVIARHDKLQQLDEIASMDMILDLQYHYYDKPRRITYLEPALESLIISLERTFEHSCAITHRTVDLSIQLAGLCSSAGRLKTADYLFNQSQAQLNPSTPFELYSYLIRVADHYRRQKRWKDVLSSLNRATALAKKMYGANHDFTKLRKDRAKAFKKEMDRMGISWEMYTPSVTSLSSIQTSRSVDEVSESESEIDEEEFLKTGMFWNPPKNLLEYA
jgi:tetratricopeptide (TPR) repeat protein